MADGSAYKPAPRYSPEDCRADQGASRDFSTTGAQSCSPADALARLIHRTALADRAELGRLMIHMGASQLFIQEGAGETAEELSKALGKYEREAA